MGVVSGKENKFQKLFLKIEKIVLTIEDAGFIIHS